MTAEERTLRDVIAEAVWHGNVNLTVVSRVEEAIREWELSPSSAESEAAARAEYELTSAWFTDGRLMRSWNNLCRTQPETAERYRKRAKAVLEAAAKVRAGASE